MPSEIGLSNLSCDTTYTAVRVYEHITYWEVDTYEIPKQYANLVDDTHIFPVYVKRNQYEQSGTYSQHMCASN